MKVILLKDVAKVGRKGEIKEVADGFGRNFIIGRGLGKLATPSSITSLKAAQASNQVHAAIQHELAIKTLESLKTATITVTVKANSEGHLFAGLHKVDIISAVKNEAKVNLEEEWLVLDKPIKTIGSHEVNLTLGDLSGLLKLEILGSN